MTLSSRFSEALVLAAEAHGAQRRKISGEPYLAHLLGVAAIALEHGADEDEAIAALLHDMIEDQGGPAARAEIARRFGPRVAEIVEGCTDADRVPKPPWAERKRAYIDRLDGASRSVRLVAAADKLHNARALLRDLRLRGDSLWAGFGGGREGTLWYYHAVVDTLMRNDDDPLVEELGRVVEEIERLASGGIRARDDSADAFHYEEGGVEILSRVAPLWEELNRHHQTLSLHFSETIAKRAFADREAVLKEKSIGGRLRVDLARTEARRDVGYCIATIDDKGTGEIDSLFVQPAFRNLGIGDALMKKAMHWMDSLGVQSRILDVAWGNEKVLSFYDQYAFLPRSIRLAWKMEKNV